ncbi:iron-sulfur cluster assembly protein [Thermodesulfobacteriota bacterium]
MAVGTIRNCVEKALSEVVDPETGLDIFRMDIIHELEIEEEGEISLVFRPSSPVCPMAYTLANSIKKKLESLDQVSSVFIRVRNFNRAEHLESLLNEPNQKENQKRK